MFVPPQFSYIIIECRCSYTSAPLYNCRHPWLACAALRDGRSSHLAGARHFETNRNHKFLMQSIEGYVENNIRNVAPSSGGNKHMYETYTTVSQ